MSSLGPFDLTGGPFLGLYATLLVLAIVAGIVIPKWLRPEGHPGWVNQTDQLAYLAGGEPRYAEVIVMRLLSAGALAIIGKGEIHVPAKAQGSNAAEAGVLALPSPIRWASLQRTLKPFGEPIARRLEASGLFMDSSLIRQMRFWQTLPYFLLLIFGAIKVEVGLMRDRPVGFLVCLMVATAVFALIRWCTVNPRTRAGCDALKAAQLQSDRLRRAPTTPEIDLAVALFGTTVLVGSGWSAFHDIRHPGGDSGGGGSSDGGGDGGGGGCGGCGG